MPSILDQFATIFGTGKNSNDTVLKYHRPYAKIPQPARHSKTFNHPTEPCKTSHFHQRTSRSHSRAPTNHIAIFESYSIFLTYLYPSAIKWLNPNAFHSIIFPIILYYVLNHISSPVIERLKNANAIKNAKSS